MCIPPLGWLAAVVKHSSTVIHKAAALQTCGNETEACNTLHDNQWIRVLGGPS